VPDTIKIRKANEHNLKNIDLDIPRDKLVVITGVSGSGKSSLAFDTLFAEGQRRYVESLSAYARQFLLQMEKPNVESIEGLSPAIAIQQKAKGHNPRSTVGTITEIYDYLRVLFARVGEVFCYNCGKRIEKQTVDQIIESIITSGGGKDIVILAPVIKGRKGEYKKTLEDLVQKGFDRGRVDGTYMDLSDDIDLARYKKHTIEADIDRFTVNSKNRSRLAESLEMGLKLGGGIVIVNMNDEDVLFSEMFSCSDCGINYEELTPRKFSFNNPYGACRKCNGLGTTMNIDPDLVVPDKKRTIREGAISTMPKGPQSFSFRALDEVAKHYGFSVDVPFEDLTVEHRWLVLYGTGTEKIHFRFQGERPGKQYRYEFERPYEGVIPALERRLVETKSSYIRRELDNYMSKRKCPVCEGERLRPESLSVRVGGKKITSITGMAVKDALNFFGELHQTEQQKIISGPVLKEIKARLTFMLNVGLDYLSLNRQSDTLSSGEAQRIQLATQIGSKLCGVLYILDEPSIGLHQRDISRLLSILVELRDLGNTLLVVEHDEETMRMADHIIDMGPGAGEHGGRVVAAGTLDEIMKTEDSLTGAFLTKKIGIDIPAQRRKPNSDYLLVRGAREHNLKNIDISIPLGVFVCVTGVSGSGKSTLINDITYKTLARNLYRAKAVPGDHDAIEGMEHIDKVIIIDQSPIGRTPRSNPATYTGVFGPIRDLFSKLPEAARRGYKPGRFSFNVKGGRCENCKGAGSILIEMHFLPDVYIGCDVCKGLRYNTETLEVRYKGKNISEVLQMTIEEGHDFFINIPTIKRKLKTLLDVGLDYMKIGQPATTLSGGEAQRVKLSRELSKKSTGRTIYILDEPTTGLHFADIKKLIIVLSRLVDSGNTVVVIEHNLDVIKSADHIIDLGPEGGDGGGMMIAQGTPEEIAAIPSSYTGKYLKGVLMHDGR